ncbi:MAG: non-heme iron oxygenase ferredoxin subunit [Verrucomicrobiae bacterium]|nr:non-heme iron oxygenase ferredoxin subunit [Verrucomicrobiae bacterium]
MSAEPEYRTIGDAADVAENRGKAYQVNGVQIAVIRHEGKLYALDEFCTHADASLAFGPVKDGCVACPWHYAEFDLETGAPKSLPAVEPVNTYPIRETADGKIEVAIPG